MADRRTSSPESRLLARRAFMVGLPLTGLSGCARRRPDVREAPSATAPSEVTVELDREVGPFSQLSGVQGSPWPDVPEDEDHRQRFRDNGVAHVRFPQDCPPNTLTLGGIFPEENADPDRAESYRFALIDKHIAASRDVGAEILWQSSYDVGRSDRWVGINLGGRAPTDLVRWARVVTRCLEHFNNGWAGGFDRAVRHVEFPNEPDGLGGFGGKRLASVIPAFEAFLRAAEAYNRVHPDTTVTAVGPGIPLSYPDWGTWRPRFEVLLRSLRASGLKLPVFSFHTYGSDTSPVANGKLALALRDLLDRHQMQETELWNTEWQATDFVRELVADRRPVRGTATSEQLEWFAAGLAAYAVCCKVRWQGVVQGSYYYRANLRAWPDDGGARPAHGNVDYGTMFASGRVSPLALQERLMREIARATPVRCLTTPAGDDPLTAVLGLKSADGSRVSVLVCNLSLRDRTFGVRLRGIRPSSGPAVASTDLGPFVRALEPRPLAAPELSGGELVLAVPVQPFCSRLVQVAVG